MFVRMRIPLYKSLEATIIDDGDWDLVSGIRWTLMEVNGKKYAAGTRNGKAVLLHRLIVKARQGANVGHEDGDGLNNRRANLRSGTRARSTVSGVSGIQAKNDKWRASIRHERRYVVLGTFDTQHEAMQARDYFCIHVARTLTGLHGVELAGFDPLKLTPAARRILASY